MATDPICGMWVEERPSSLQLIRDNRTYYFCSETCLHQFAEPAREQRRLLRRLVVAWPLAIAVLALTYLSSSTTSIVAAAAFATVVQFYPGATFYAGTHDAVRERSWNMDLLIAVGTTTAFGYSVAALAPPLGVAARLLLRCLLADHHADPDRELSRTSHSDPRGFCAPPAHTSSFPRRRRSYGERGIDPFRSAKSWWATASGSVQGAGSPSTA